MPERQICDRERVVHNMASCHAGLLNLTQGLTSLSTGMSWSWVFPVYDARENQR